MSDTEESVTSVSFIEENEALNLSGDRSEANNSGQTSLPAKENTMPAGDSIMVLDSNHPLMLKYQQDLKEQLLKLINEADEELVDLNRTIYRQEKENEHFAKQAFEFQKEIELQEEKLVKIQENYDKEVEKKQDLGEKLETIRSSFRNIEEKLNTKRKNDLEYQKKLEDIAFKVVQLTSLQDDTFTDSRSLQRAVEKSAKDRQNLELQKLRQDLLILRLENDKYGLEDKINLYKTQWAIKKEEIADLRKELNVAHSEMERINSEKQQIIHQWRQSLASLEKQDRVLSERRDSIRSFEDELQVLQMEISSHKKAVRIELERNENLTVSLQYRESEVARSEKELKDAAERENHLMENLSLIEKIIEITENELRILNDGKVQKEKELEVKEREIQKYCSMKKSLEEKRLNILHEKITVTKASKYTEKLIKDVRKSTDLVGEKGSEIEREKGRLLLQLDNLTIYTTRLEKNFVELQKENKEKEDLLDKSETSVVKMREKMDAQRNEYKNLYNELKEIISRAGGEELAPFERELASLRNEINTAEQERRDLEHEYLRFQNELFAISKQSSVRSEENDMYNNRILIMEGKKIQIEADIAKEAKNIKNTQSQILYIEKEVAHINKLISERKELQEYLKQAADLLKSDFNQSMKADELLYLQKETALHQLRKKKAKVFSKILKIQKDIINWERKLNLVEETRRRLTSESHLAGFFEIRSDIRQLQLKQEKIKMDQKNLIQEMSKAVYRHTSLYVEADKQALSGKRRKSPEYVKKRIKNNMKKIAQDKKDLENYVKQVESSKATETQLEDTLASENCSISHTMDYIKATEHETDVKIQEKCRAVLRLCFKQKKGRYFEKIKDGSYIRAVRNEGRRAGEIMKIQTCLRAIQVIIEATINEYPELTKNLSKIGDYIIVSKEF